MLYLLSQNIEKNVRERLKKIKLHPTNCPPFLNLTLTYWSFYLYLNANILVAKALGKVKTGSVALSKPEHKKPVIERERGSRTCVFFFWPNET